MVDGLLLATVTFPFLLIIYGPDYFSAGTDFVAGPADLLITWVMPMIATIAFWVYRQATPGKMAFSIRVVAAETGSPLSLRQLVIRYLAYFVSALPVGLGYLWVVFDPKKQGWHDKLAGSVVVKSKRNGLSSGDFEGKSEQ